VYFNTAQHGLCPRKWFEKVGGYDSIRGAPGLPEDMVFFHRHLDLGGGLFKVDVPLGCRYRYRKDSMSSQIHRLGTCEG